MIPFALSVPRPLVWLMAKGVVRDLTLTFDPSRMLGEVVGLYSAAHGDHHGYRHLARMLAGTDLEGTTVAQVRAECPKCAVVGTAVIAAIERAPHGWRVHLTHPTTIKPLAVPQAEPELRALPDSIWNPPTWTRTRPRTTHAPDPRGGGP